MYLFVASLVYKLEAQVSLYYSPDLNKPIAKCLHDKFSTKEGHLGCRLGTIRYINTLKCNQILGQKPGISEKIFKTFFS